MQQPLQNVPIKLLRFRGKCGKDTGLSEPVKRYSGAGMASEKGHPWLGAAVPVRREGQTRRPHAGGQQAGLELGDNCTALLSSSHLTENQLTKEIHSFQSPREELRRALNLRDNS